MSAALATPVRFTSTLIATNPKGMPANEIVEGRYLVRLARTKDEVDAALKLRFQIFNLELGQGLPSSFNNASDRDELDSTSHHMILIDRMRREMIGTCRLRTFDIAKSVERFCSSRKFDLTTLPGNVMEAAVEIDRACITPSYRHSSAFSLLWKALALYATQRQKVYFFGSLPMSTQDPLNAGKIFEYLSNGGFLHQEFRVKPRPGFKCLWYSMPATQSRFVLPHLFRSHLRMGVKLCGWPAFDRQLGSIDFPVLLDLTQIGPKACRSLFDFSSFRY